MDCVALASGLRDVDTEELSKVVIALRSHGIPCHLCRLVRGQGRRNSWAAIQAGSTFCPNCQPDLAPHLLCGLGDIVTCGDLETFSMLFVTRLPC